MAPTIQKEADGGRAAAASAEAARPTRIASRQLAADTWKKLGAIRVDEVADMARGTLRFLVLQGGPASPCRAAGRFVHSTGGERADRTLSPDRCFQPRRGLGNRTAGITPQLTGSFPLP